MPSSTLRCDNDVPLAARNYNLGPAVKVGVSSVATAHAVHTDLRAFVACAAECAVVSAPARLTSCVVLSADAATRATAETLWTEACAEAARVRQRFVTYDVDVEGTVEALRARFACVANAEQLSSAARNVVAFASDIAGSAEAPHPKVF